MIRGDLTSTWQRSHRPPPLSSPSSPSSYTRGGGRGGGFGTWRGRGTTTTTRGSWQSRGAGLGVGSWRTTTTRDSFSNKQGGGEEEAVKLGPVGNLVAEYKLEDISNTKSVGKVKTTITSNKSDTTTPTPTPTTTTTTIGEEEVKITNCAYAASYSLVTRDDGGEEEEGEGEASDIIVVPGTPPTWRPPPLPRRVPRDAGVYMRDQNGSSFPLYPMQAAAQAILALPPSSSSPSSIDILGCASSLGDILRFCRGVESTFRFDVEMVGDDNTLFLVRNGGSDVIPGVYGYGHSFLEKFTCNDEDGGGRRKVKSHQRIISYDLAGLKCLIRFECDSYMEDKKSEEEGVLIRDPPLQFTPPEADTIPMENKGKIVPQDLIMEIKTRSAARGEIDKAEHVPRLWLRQIPFLVSGYHLQGKFTDVRVEDIRPETAKWEAEHQDELAKFVSVLRQVIAEVKRARHLDLELCREGTGPLQLRERLGEARKALPDSWERRWIADFGQGENPARLHSDDGGSGDTDREEDGEEYPSARTSSDLSDDSRGSFSFDYTECSVDCGYCGRCCE